MSLYYDTIDTMFGKYYLVFSKKGLVRVNLSEESFMEEYPDKKRREFPKAVSQLNEYFNGTRKTFSIALAPTGTAFQKKVWKAAISIPFGQTRSYRWIATTIGNKNAYRAVGNALGVNPIPIIIPCHRIIKENKEIGGYSGPPGLKQKLLSFESANTATNH